MGRITGSYPDYTSALADCREGYSNSGIAEVVSFKAAVPIDVSAPAPEQAINTLLAVGLAAADAPAGPLPSGPLKVLDFGGGCGFHYFQAARRFGRGSMKWAIVETPTMAHAAARLSREGFAAFSTVEAAVDYLGNVDLVHTSGTLQCLPDPMRSLRALLELRARHFMLARFPQWRGPTRIGIQESRLSDNGIGPMPPGISNDTVHYPNTFVDYDTCMHLITACGYGLLLSTASPSADYIVDNTTVEGRSLFFKLV